MKAWESWVYDSPDGLFNVMIRNHKTSQALVQFRLKADAERQAAKLSTYPWFRLVELYRTAITTDILTLHHEDTFVIEIIENGYGLYFCMNGNKVLLKKDKYRRVVEAWFKEKKLKYRGEHSFAVIVKNYILKRSKANR